MTPRIFTTSDFHFAAMVSPGGELIATGFHREDYDSAVKDAQWLASRLGPDSSEWHITRCAVCHGFIPEECNGNHVDDPLVYDSTPLNRGGAYAPSTAEREQSEINGDRIALFRREI